VEAPGTDGLVTKAAELAAAKAAKIAGINAVTNGLDEADYTTGSWQALQTSITDAINQVDDAATVNAVNAVSVPGMDVLITKAAELAAAKAAKIAAINAVTNGLDEADYTTGSWQALQTAMSDAISQVNAATTVDEVNAVETPNTDVLVRVYVLSVNSGTGGGNFAQGEIVTITAGNAPTGQRFKQWNISPTVTFTGGTNATSATAKFTMPAGAVTATATYEPIPATTYTVTVNSGTGGGNFAQGATVTITASNAPTGQRFKQWNVSPAVTFTGGTNATSATAKFTMPAGTVTATATYENIPTPLSFTVTYNTDGGSPATIAPVTVANGTSIALPTAPTKSKSIFKGWKTGNTTLAAGASYTVTGNVTFTAQWVKTIFSTKYEATFFNWILFIFGFGFIWMWFARP